MVVNGKDKLMASSLSSPHIRVRTMTGGCASLGRTRVCDYFGSDASSIPKNVSRLENRN